MPFGWQWPWQGRSAQLNRIENGILDLKREIIMAKVDLTKLTAAVERDTNVTSSAVTAIGGLNTSVQELKQEVADLIAAGGTVAEIQAAVDAKADEINANSDALAAAVPANS